jgi:menaquinone-dependent protoporphyrinogen IX oxidase
MQGALIYYSRYGNNEKTAKAAAAGLVEAGHSVTLINARQKKGLDGEYDFLVVGSPTRAGRTSGPVKKFIKRNVGEDWKGKPFAAFGTCLNRACEKGEPTAAKDIQRELEGRGLKPLADPFDNPVSGMKGPLAEDGEAKAREFGKMVGQKLSA